jgi:hypothetical protein
MTQTKNPSMIIIPLRGNRDDALNGFMPGGDPNRSFGSSDAGDPERWLAVAVGEEETDLLLRITAMVADDNEVSEESRALAKRLNTLMKACIEDFATYEQRKAEDLPTSTPISS